MFTLTTDTREGRWDQGASSYKDLDLCAYFGSVVCGAAVLTLKDNDVSAADISFKPQCGHIHQCQETSAHT